ncbi:MAG: cyclic nucleotide-binding domain-containing protein [Planctomycetota bacterium]|jgi:CRP-like cAMP-binding protein
MRKVLYILGALHDEDMQWLVDAGDVRNVDAGAEIITEGGSADSLFIVLEGTLRVSKAGAEIATLSIGEVAGEMSFLDSRPNSASVTATSQAAIFSVPRDALRAKLERDTAFGARFYRALGVFLANRLEQANQRFGSAGGDEAEQDEFDPEMSINVLDSVALAGARFDWFRKRLLGAKGR